jgi:hypothetical protein
MSVSHVQGDHSASVTAQNLVLDSSIGGGLSTQDFAQLVRVKEQEVEQLTSSHDTNQDADHLVQQFKNEEGLQQQLSTLKGSLTITYEGSTDNAQKEQIALLLGQINELEALITNLITTTLTALAGMSSQNTATKTQTSDPSNPNLPPGDPKAEVSSSEQGNLFLATGYMAILFAVQQELIHIGIEIKDSERVMKQFGFENIRTLGNLEAQAAYKSEMAQANMYMAQAICGFVTAGVVAGFGVATATKQTAQQEQLNKMQDNPAYTKRLDEMKGELNTLSANLQADLKMTPPRVTDANGEQIMPGQKQLSEMESDLNLQKQDLENNIVRDKVDPKQTTTEISTPQQKADVDAKLNDLKQVMRQNSESRTALQHKLTTDSGLLMMQTIMPQAIRSFIEGMKGMFDFAFQSLKAKADFERMLYSTCKEVGNKYLQSALESFSSEDRAQQAKLDMLMQSASKNTQWGSIRA